jgi:NAD-dependent dihydropyrimidine dehydrogenase PreA subunit
VGALAVRELRATIVHPEDCRYCGECEELCPVGAISRPFEILFPEKA